MELYDSNLYLRIKVELSKYGKLERDVKILLPVHQCLRSKKRLARLGTALLYFRLSCEVEYSCIPLQSGRMQRWRGRSKTSKASYIKIIVKTR